MTYAFRNQWSFSVRLVVSLMACWFAASSAWTFADEMPIAMLTEVVGDIELLHDSKADGLRLLAELKPKGVVRLKKGARAVVLYLKDGNQFDLSGSCSGKSSINQDSSLFTLIRRFSSSFSSLR